MSDIDVSNDGHIQKKSIPGNSSIMKQGEVGFIEEGSREEELHLLSGSGSEE